MTTLLHERRRLLAYRSDATAWVNAPDGASPALPSDTARSGPTRGPMADGWIESIVRTADTEHGSLLAALDLDYDDALDPDHHDPLTIPRRMEALT